jgi:hypothetical protein
MKNKREILESLMHRGLINVKYENPSGVMIEYPGDIEEYSAWGGTIESVGDEMIVVRMNQGGKIYLDIDAITLILEQE